MTRNLNIKAKLSFDVANWRLMLGVLLAYRNHAVGVLAASYYQRFYYPGVTELIDDTSDQSARLQH